MSFGEPGLLINAKRFSTETERAPGSYVNYRITDSSGMLKTNGRAEKIYFDSSKQIAELISSSRNKGYKLAIDSEHYLIGFPKNSLSSFNSSSNGFDSLDDGRAVLISQYYNGKNEIALTTRDTFPDMQAGRRGYVEKDFETGSTIIQEGGITEKLRILPSGMWQRVLFFFYQLITSGCLVMLFYTLAVLFKRFSEHNFFTVRTRKLVLNAGWLILIPELASLLFYFIFLFGKQADKVSYNSTDTFYKRLIHYQFETGVNFQLLTLGLGLIVLAYIFREGVELKEESQLTV
jgi:hypothetical protein